MGHPVNWLHTVLVVIYLHFAKCFVEIWKNGNIITRFFFYKKNTVFLQERFDIVCQWLGRLVIQDSDEILIFFFTLCYGSFVFLSTFSAKSRCVRVEDDLSLNVEKKMKAKIDQKLRIPPQFKRL